MRIEAKLEEMGLVLPEPARLPPVVLDRVSVWLVVHGMVNAARNRREKVSCKFQIETVFWV